MVAGAIATISDEVIGLSNVFQAEPDARQAWDELVTTVAQLWPAKPVVGYESGDSLEAALSAGFADLGPLRVWQRGPTD